MSYLKKLHLNPCIKVAILTYSSDNHIFKFLIPLWSYEVIFDASYLQLLNDASVESTCSSENLHNASKFTQLPSSFFCSTWIHKHKRSYQSRNILFLYDNGHLLHCINIFQKFNFSNTSKLRSSVQIFLYLPGTTETCSG